jgi:beta-glucosidase
VKVTGDRGVDAYTHVAEDVKLLRSLGVNAYRFSIAWTRVLPDGDGEVNAKGLAFYKDLVKRLRDAGIKPVVTLFHWDTPQKLQDRGGFTNREMADWFDRYARVVMDALGDDVAAWTTFNEPFVTAFLGHYYGKYPPGTQDFSSALLAVHHILLSHGRAVAAHRSLARKGPIGITLDMPYAYPASDKPEDRAAAERENRFHLGIFADPIWKGRYPREVLAYFAERGVVLPAVTDQDLATIHQPTDFLGLNFYYSTRKEHAPGRHWPLEHHELPPPTPRGDGDPQGLYDLLRWAQREYQTRLMVTENGMNLPDAPDARGVVADDRRIAYLYRHMAAVRRAMDDGVDVAGYFVWTFMDNYEWGDWSRMGLVYTDFATGRRIVKNSGKWFAEGMRHGFRSP